MQSNQFPALGGSSGFGAAPGAALSQDLAASMGMNSASSMSDPLGWMGPPDARNSGIVQTPRGDHRCVQKSDLRLATALLKRQIARTVFGSCLRPSTILA
jgi:hypothetical protein